MGPGAPGQWRPRALVACRGRRCRPGSRKQIHRRPARRRHRIVAAHPQNAPPPPHAVALGRRCPSRPTVHARHRLERQPRMGQLRQAGWARRRLEPGPGRTLCRRTPRRPGRAGDTAAGRPVRRWHRRRRPPLAGPAARPPRSTRLARCGAVSAATRSGGASRPTGPPSSTPPPPSPPQASSHAGGVPLPPSASP